MPPRPGQDGTYECYRRRNEPRDDKRCRSHGGGQHRHERDPSEREHRKRPTRSQLEFILRPGEDAPAPNHDRRDR